MDIAPYNHDAEPIHKTTHRRITMAALFEVKKTDPFMDKVLKYIPPEIVATYVAVEGALTGAFDPANPGELAQLRTWLWISFFALLVITPFFRWRVTGVTNIGQLIVTTLSFAVWVFALGGPFAYFPWYMPVLPAIILPFYTLLVPIFFPGS
jgi:hypothetical protein